MLYMSVNFVISKRNLIIIYILVNNNFIVAVFCFSPVMVIHVCDEAKNCEFFHLA